MPQFDAGVFIVMVSLAFSSLVISFKLGSAFRVLGAIIFFAIAIIMFANYDIAYKSMTDDGTTKINETKYIIGDGDPKTNEQTNWLGWIFLGLGVYSSMLFLFDMMNQLKQRQDYD